MPRRFSLAVVALVLAALPAPAVIQSLLPLKDVIQTEQLIFVAAVDSVAPDRPGAVFKVTGKLKGDVPFDRLAVNLTGNAEAKKGDHTKVLLDRLAPGREAVVFARKKGKRYEAMACVEGTWFSMQGAIDDDGKTVRWALVSAEPYLRRTFKGTSAELKKAVEDALAGKADPPALDEKAAPGFGPPVEKKEPKKGDKSEGAAAPVHSAALFGVIPSIALLGPMALIAALFPGVAARMAVGMKRWRAFLVTASTNSTLAIVYWLLRDYQLLPDWWVFSYKGFTALLLVTTTVGLIWAGQRYRRMAAGDPGVTATPRRNELLALAGLTALVALVAASARFFGPWSAVVDLPMREFTLIGAALVAATLYTAYRLAAPHPDRLPDGTDPAVRLSLSGESVGLGALFLGSVVALFVGGNTGAHAVAVGTQSGDADDGYGPKLLDVKVFELPAAHQVMSGITVDGDRLLLGASKTTGFGADGFVFAVDRHTGKELWRFSNDDDLKPVFCTPTAAGGKVYFGEGLHTDKECRLFCVDAATGKAAWDKPFSTTSHTEGNPRVVNGNAIFTAGDDGLFCVDAATGVRKWQFPGAAQQLHIDGPPAVAGNRVFVGSGLYTLALLAVDVETGKELWRTPAGLRSFGAPLVVGNRVVYGLGTGNMSADTFKYDEEKGTPEESAPAGAVVCVEADTGKEAWRYDLARSVHTAPAADAFSVYATARDGAVHCLDRKTGKLRWRTVIGATCTAGPAVATAGGYPVAVYAISTEGLMTCLHPQTGKVVWARDLREHTKRLVEEVYTAPVVVTEPTPTGSRRAVYTGAMVRNPNNGAKTAAVFRFDDELGE